MKPKFRLHYHDVRYLAAVNFWTCTVEIPRDEDNTIKKHSGPCTTAASAIGEATLLWRKYSHA